MNVKLHSAKTRLITLVRITTKYVFIKTANNVGFLVLMSDIPMEENRFLQYDISKAASPPGAPFSPEDCIMN
jgi:hypothetical protein